MSLIKKIYYKITHQPMDNSHSKIYYDNDLGILRENIERTSEAAIYYASSVLLNRKQLRSSKFSAKNINN